MTFGRLDAIVIVGIILEILPTAFGQGTLADYQRAKNFLPGNLRHSIYIADVSPHWIDKTNRFWYHKVSPQATEFILVDADHNTQSPAFDHQKLAAALAQATHREISATELPFEDIDFSDDGKSITFETAGDHWRCTLADYNCHRVPAENSEEGISPDKKWFAYVKDHNLYLRDTSTGTSVQLTTDGIAGWDYATPLPSLRLYVEQGTDDVHQPASVFWSPDSTKLITFRIDSRNSGRFTSVQFVPPGQLRPKAYSVVYPLPGEVLATATVMVFDVLTGARVDVKTEPLQISFQGG